jgi:ligand-binding sensor domain-containing protein
MGDTHDEATSVNRRREIDGTVLSRRGGHRCGVLMFLCLLLASLVGAGGAQGMPLSQYGHTAWRVEDGLLPGTPQAISQTTDGYIWVGTTVGLVRFDGVRFSPWTQWPAGREASSSIYALLGSKDGSLWIASAAGLARIRGGVLSYLPASRGRINALAQATDGTIWFAKTRDTDVLCRMDQDRYACLGAKDGLGCRFGQSLSPDRSGGIWLGSDSGFCHWTNGAIKYSNPLGQPEESHTPPALTSLELDNGDVLVGYAAIGPHFGLQKLTTNGSGAV